MDQIQIEMALDKNYLVPDEIQNAYLMVKLTAPELGGTTRPKELQAEIMELNSSLQFMSVEGYDKSLRKKMSSQAYQQRRGRGK